MKIHNLRIDVGSLALIPLLIMIMLSPTAWATAETESEEPEHTEEEAALDPENKVVAANDHEAQDYLDFQMDQLKNERLALELLHKEIQTSVKQMKKIQNRIDSLRNQEKEFEENKLQELVGIYQKIKPDQIVPLLMQLEPSLRYEILSRLKTKTVSQILVLLPPDIAAITSKKLLEIRNSTTETED